MIQTFILSSSTMVPSCFFLRKDHVFIHSGTHTTVHHVHTRTQPGKIQMDMCLEKKMHKAPWKKKNYNDTLSGHCAHHHRPPILTSVVAKAPPERGKAAVSQCPDARSPIASPLL
jgi:hypothetical protein